MVRGKWSEVEARGVLEAWRRSGLSLERFAKQRGLSPQRLYRWRQKLAPGEKGAAPIRACTLLPVRLTSESRVGDPVAVMLRTGHVLKVARGFDEDAFTRVVALLEGT